MSFELSHRESIRDFFYILKSLVTNGDKATMIFRPNEILLLQNFHKMEDFMSEKLSTVYSFKSTFFSNVLYPKLNKENYRLIFEVDISKIYKKLVGIRKMITSFSFDIPAFLEKKEEFFKEMKETPDFSVVIKYSSAGFTLEQKLVAESDPSIDLKSVFFWIDCLKSDNRFAKILEFKKDNMVNLKEFKNVFLDIIMNEEYVFCKQADIPMNYSINIKKTRLEDYSNYACMKHFEGRNKLQLHANKLLNYMQLCKELRKNPSIFLSKNQNSNGNTRILMPISENHTFEGFYYYVGLISSCEENEINLKNPFESCDNSFYNENEIEEENEEINERNSENQRVSLNKSISEVELDEIDQALEEFHCESEKPQSLLNKINPQSNSAINYFGFINEENEEEFKEKENDFKTRANELISKLTKRKNYESIDLDNYEKKKKKLVDSSFNFSNGVSLNLEKTKNFSENNNFLQISKTFNDNVVSTEKTNEKSLFTKDPNYLLKNRNFFK